MLNFNTQAQVLTELNIKIAFPELEGKIQTSSKRPDIIAAAEKTLEMVNNIWDPAIVYRWLPFGENSTASELCTNRSDDSRVALDLGHSSIFIKKASYGLIAAYSAGNRLEEKTQKATKNQDFLAAFLLDLIGLLVLEKTGDIVKRVAEQKAAELGWGVSPFLSPGSIHGWELEEQLKLCPLLPLDQIGVHLLGDATLTPLKSLSCLIGVGPDYKASMVGTTCQVCSKNHNCQMSQLYTR
jgi:hypothetical protein